MNNMVSVKTNFTSGQISQNLFGRGDLSIFENGSAKLENVVIHPTGGISRRKGLKFVDKIDKRARLIPFEFNTEQVYLLCICDKEVKVYRNGVCIKTLTSPWSASHLNKLNYTQSADTLLIVHPDVAPKQITRNTDEDWRIEDWGYYEKDGLHYCPYYNFFQHREKISPRDTNGTITITSISPLFNNDYVGVRLRIRGGEVTISQYINTHEVVAQVTKSLGGAGDTTEWEEQAFSKVRGWPNSITFHQDRLVIGGSKRLPNRLWLSKSSDLFNFDLGKGLDDESIEFAILSDQVNAIKAVASSRHLLVFTTGAEWMVSGDPLTPTSIQLKRQTNVGSYAKENIYPQHIDGATVFISQSGRQLREFLYTDVEQAYQAKDLTLMSSDIIAKPIDIAFHQDDCVLYIVLEDGTISSLTTYRSEEVTAWSKLITTGKFLSLAVIGDEIYFCVERNNKFFIEVLDKNFYVDSGIKLSSETSQKEWNGMNNLEGCEVAVLADGFSVGKYLVNNGSITLLEEAKELIVGLPYEHVIEPLPYVVDATKPYSPQSLRIISGLFRLIETQGFCINMGSGYIQVPLKRLFRDNILDAPLITYSGDIKLRALGWIREMNKPLWSIKTSEPMSFTLLSAVLEVKVKD